MNYLSRIINDITTYFLTNPFIVITQFFYHIDIEESVLFVEWVLSKYEAFQCEIKFDRDKLSSENYRSEIVSGVLCEINTTLYSIDDYLN